MNKAQLNYWQERFFDIFIFTSYLLIFLTTFKLSQSAPKYLESIDYYVKSKTGPFLLFDFAIESKKITDKVKKEKESKEKAAAKNKNANQSASSVSSTRFFEVLTKLEFWTLSGR